nr:hypothetical protein [Corallococcus sp. AB045]
MTIPAFVKTLTFQVVAWNRAAVAVFGDYGAVPERERTCCAGPSIRVRSARFTSSRRFVARVSRRFASTSREPASPTRRRRSSTS